MSDRLKIIFAVALAVVIGNVTWVFVEPRLNQAPPPPHPDIAQVRALKPIARTGDVGAQFKLAELYFHARGIAPDDAQAFALYQSSANGGHPGGQFGLGRMFETGRGVRQDLGRAADWYRVSALLGRYADSQYALGLLYFSGRGVEHSYGLAMEWFMSAAKRGHAGSQYLVGTMYRDGWGVPVNVTESYLWFSLAAEHTAQSVAANPAFDPVQALEQLQKKMTRVQIREAKTRRAQYDKAR